MINTPTLEDTSPMPFGKFKGKLLQDVSANYLHWLWENWDGKSPDKYGIMSYIKNSMSALREETPDKIWSTKR